jgi:hypothetical protein
VAGGVDQFEVGREPLDLHLVALNGCRHAATADPKVATGAVDQALATGQ